MNTQSSHIDHNFIYLFYFPSGIMQLISYCEPRNVMLVHGEAQKMEFLKQKIK